MKSLSDVIKIFISIENFFEKCQKLGIQIPVQILNVSYSALRNNVFLLKRQKERNRKPCRPIQGKLKYINLGKVFAIANDDIYKFKLASS